MRLLTILAFHFYPIEYMLRSYIALCCYLLCFTIQGYGQTGIIDRLKKNIETAPNQSKKLQALFSFCEQRNSLSTDTLCKYASVAKKISLGRKQISEIATADYYVANCLVKQGALNTALQICESNIVKLGDQGNNAALVMKLAVLKAQILVKSNRYKEGLAEVYKVLQDSEQTNDTLMQMIAKNGIGWINMEMGQTSEALKWFFRALNITPTGSFHERNSNIYSNIAAIYKQVHKYDSAEHYIKKSLAFSRKSENLFYLANSLSILADIYIETNRTAQAEPLLTEALAIREKIGDPYYIVSDISLLAIYYANTSQSRKGIALSLQGIQLAEEFNLGSKLPYLYHALGENYKAAGNYNQYSRTLEKIQVLKDSVYSANSAASRAEMDALYNLKKKENVIIQQQLDISRKNSLFSNAIILLLFMSVLGWLLFQAYKKDQEIKLFKIRAEEKLLAAHAVVTAQENERKRIARDLHDNIGAYATVLTASAEKLSNQDGMSSIQQIVETVSDNAKKIISSLQETIWILSNDVITVTDFIDRFKLYAKKMLQHFPDIQIKFREEIHTDAELSPSEALHLVRIMQEALQNTLKHAAAKNIEVAVESKETILISIRDDGKGFSNDNSTGCNGLLNMKHRVNEAGYELKILSTEAGTEVRLQKNRAYAVL